MSTPTYRTPRLARLIQPASPQGASSSEVAPSFSSSRGNSARNTAVASISEPSPEADAAAPQKVGIVDPLEALLQTQTSKGFPVRKIANARERAGDRNR